MNTVPARPHEAATLLGAGDEPRGGRAWLDEPEIPRLRLRLVLSAILTAELILLAILGYGMRVAWLELALATPVVAWAALPFFERTIEALRRRSVSMFTLISLGVLLAYLYGAAATFAPHIHDGRPLTFAAAGTTVTLVLFSEYIERLARRRASVEIADVDTVRRALAPATPLETIGDRVGGAIVPAVLVVAALTFVGWVAFGPSPKLVHAVEGAVAVLVIACPAALGLATPLAFLMATASAKRSGIHLRDAALTETLARVTTLVLDRTGVLTEGAPVVRCVEPAPGFDRAELLRLAAAAEYECEHPVARAVVAHAAPRYTDDDAPHSIRRPIAGRGVVAEVRGRDVVLGSQALFSARGIEVPEAALGRAEELRRTGASVSFAAVDGCYAGLVALGDSARENAREAIADLRTMGIRVVMMSGSSRTLGRHVARELDLHDAEIFAHVHPEDRAHLIHKLRERGETVAVVGRHEDAASVAHVGLAFDPNQPSDVSLPAGDLDSLVRTLRLARRTVRNVHQNFVIAIGYNLFAIPVAAVTGMSPLVAAGVMGLGTLLVLLSSLSLLSRDPGR
jgi:Cu+-exporting ATPase